MSHEEPPVFEGIPCRGCMFFKNACSIVHNLSVGEYILALREPHNKSDCNAIRVYDEAGNTFGYIGREYAAEIAPWMDRGWSFLVQKTDRIRCNTIVRFEPILPAKKSVETKTEEPLNV